MAAKQLWQCLKKPKQLLGEVPQISPVYFNDGRNTTLIITESHVGDAGIWQYDLDQQTIIAKFKYPDNGRIIICAHALDSERKILYLMGKFYEMEASLVSFDFNTKKWTQLWELDEDEDEMVDALYIPSPINELHLVTDNHNYRFSKIDDVYYTNFMERYTLSKSKDSIIQKDTLMYCKQLGMLMVYETHSGWLFSNIKSKDQQNFNWRRCRTKYNENIADSGWGWFSVFLGWDQIIFWLEFDENADDSDDDNDNDKDKDNKDLLFTVWCLDLLHDDQWYKSQLFYRKDLPGDWNNPDTFTDDDNSLHFMSLKEDNSYHYKMSLYSIIPKQIIDLNQNELKPLIRGFVKKFEKNNEMIFIPLYLQDLIVQFYPVFI